MEPQKQLTYQEEKALRFETMKNILVGVAKNLGNGWALNFSKNEDGEYNDIRDHWGRLSNGDKTLSFYWPYNRTSSVEIVVGLPKRKDGQNYSWRDYGVTDITTKIGCNANKEPNKIAADIKRRLLSTYDEAFSQALKRINEDQAKQNARATTLKEFEKLLKTKSHTTQDVSKYDDEMRVKVRVEHDGDRVDVDFHSLDKELAKKLIKLAQKEISK